MVTKPLYLFLGWNFSRFNVVQKCQCTHSSCRIYGSGNHDGICAWRFSIRPTNHTFSSSVLKSYWLIIHVAIITSSYGFFALSMIIAVISLFFYIISSKKTFDKHDHNTIKELTIVSEMSLTIGLFALTVGNFLGVWANESWGRYWSWDPKETWAFISIIVYAFVLHMRLVPGLRGRYAFQFNDHVCIL